MVRAAARGRDDDRYSRLRAAWDHGRARSLYCEPDDIAASYGAISVAEREFSSRASPLSGNSQLQPPAAAPADLVRTSARRFQPRLLAIPRTIPGRNASPE